MASILRRLRARLRLRGRVGLWHHREYEPPELARSARVPRLPLGRVELALAELDREGLLGARSVRPSPIASFEDLERAHARFWIEEAARPDVLGRVFGVLHRVGIADDYDATFSFKRSKRRRIQHRSHRINLDFGGFVRFDGQDVDVNASSDAIAGTTDPARVDRKTTFSRSRILAVDCRGD